MPRQPLVSIITPSYNRFGHIQNCLASVRGQTYANVEHIVIDGGSKDGTVELLASKEKEYGLRWISERDEGMYHAINKGLCRASGDIVAYLNTDDLYFPWSVAVAVEEILAGAAVVYGDLCVVKQGLDVDDWRLQFYPGFRRRYYARYATIGQPTVFMRREVHERVGPFGGQFRLLGDCDYWLRCSEAGYEPKKIDEVLAVQIDHDETLREKHAKRLVEEFALLSGSHGYGHRRPHPLLNRAVSALATRAAKMPYVATPFRGSSSRGWREFRAAMAGFGATFNQTGALKSLLPAAFMAGANSGYEAHVSAADIVSLCSAAA